MIVNDDFLKKIRSAFDLNIYEAKIWAALLSKGVASAGELSDISDVPRSRSYDVLESLEKRGFIIMKIGRPIKYIAVKPEEVMRRLKKEHQEVAIKSIKSLEGVEKTDAFAELNLLFKQGIENVDPMNVSGAFKGRNNIYDHILSMLDNAQKDVVIVTSTDGIVRKVEALKSTLRKLSNKGVKIKIAAPLKTDKAKEAAKEISEFATVRDVNLNARFVLVDGKELIFMIKGDKEVHESYDSGIWVNSPFFASSLKSMFDTAWVKA